MLLRAAPSGLRDASAIATAALIGISGMKKRLLACIRPDRCSTVVKLPVESTRSRDESDTSLPMARKHTARRFHDG
jgi:hypothetical protein